MQISLPGDFGEMMAGRPRPRPEFDQVHMVAEDCYLHALDLLPLLAGRKALFLGDADCISLAVMYAAIQRASSPPARISVLDFDKRVLSYIRQQAAGLGSTVELETRLYNVISPSEPCATEAPDFFHVNPPFGSRNGGLSAAVWLYRAADMCRGSCAGCVVLAANHDRSWCRTVQAHVSAECGRLGFADGMPLETRHAYDSPWDPGLRSRAHLVVREQKLLSPLFGTTLPDEYREGLYGDPIQVPEYIE